MSEETVASKTPQSRRWTWIIRGVLWTLMMLFFSAVSGCTLMLETPVHFLLGWLFHAVKTLPQALGSWKAFLLPLGCLILAGVLIHRFVQRCWVARGTSRRLRPTDTLAALSLLLLGCGAAIALSGIIHQTVWLMSDPWTENRGKRADLTACVSDARQLMMALTEFHHEKGHYPDSLQDLITEVNLPPNLAWVRYGTGKVREPFILLHPGGKRALNAHEPLIVSAVLQRDQKIVVGYGDFSVRSLPAKMLHQILEDRDLSEKPVQP